MIYYLAIDIGASSGRHILGSIQDGKLQLEEVYRFANAPTEKDGKLTWDTERLFAEILFGMRQCARLGKYPHSVGIDTWGVDYALLDKNDQLLGEVFCYRDSRTKEAAIRAERRAGRQWLYERTGIQFQPYNTIFQLEDDQYTAKIKQARTMLMLPSYFNFLLTGIKANEYTSATTTGLVNAKTRDWDAEIIKKFGFSRGIFADICPSASILGELSPDIQQIVGYNTNVVLPPSHDTASAVVAVPTSDALYISSGTWSLLGTELSVPRTDMRSFECNYANEGGFCNKYRYLKNIMGMWIVQCVRREQGNKYSFEQIAELAQEGDGFSGRIDVDSAEFLAPKSMTDQILVHLQNTSQPTPQSDAELYFCIYKSLAEAYGRAIEELEWILQKKYDTIYIVGGGCQNEFLNRLTANQTNKRVAAGPVEATAIGNLCVQMIAAGDLKDVRAAKQLINQSFNVVFYDKRSEL